MDESTKRKVDHREELETALEARDQFLKEHPDLQPFQDEIDQILSKTVGAENRLKALAFMIEKKVCELNGLITDLKDSYKVQTDSKMEAAKAEEILENFQNPTGYVN
ncbi:MAG: hypothetical protein ACP5SH_27285 [Syntrophobacteraceae bacterium]